jgi:hypothetical protein
VSHVKGHILVFYLSSNHTHFGNGIILNLFNSTGDISQSMQSDLFWKIAFQNVVFQIMFAKAPLSLTKQK